MDRLSFSSYLLQTAREMVRVHDDLAAEVARLERAHPEAVPVERHLSLARATLRVVVQAQTLATSLLAHVASEHAEAEERDERIRELHRRVQALEARGSGDRIRAARSRLARLIAPRE